MAFKILEGFSSFNFTRSLFLPFLFLSYYVACISNTVTQNENHFENTTNIPKNKWILPEGKKNQIWVSPLCRSILLVTLSFNGFFLGFPFMEV